MGATSSRGIARRIGASLLIHSVHVISGDAVAYYRSRGRATRTDRQLPPARPDRAPGLFALIPLAGAAAAYSLLASPSSPSNDPAIAVFRSIALTSAALMAALTVFGALFVDPTVRRGLGTDRLLRRLPMQARLRGVVRALDGYRRHPRGTARAVARAFPAHAARVGLAALGGAAVGLPLAWHQYAAVVPVVVLLAAAAAPVVPHAVGVLEAAAFLLGRAAGLGAAEALPLAVVVRGAAVVWAVAAVIAARVVARDRRPARARRRVPEPEAWVGETRGAAADFPEPA